jgi:hypothetical protein
MNRGARRQQKTETLSKLYDGKLRLERRNGAPKIFARTYLQGKNLVRSTGEQTLGAATRVATDWYLELRDRVRILHANQVREVSEGQRRNYQGKWNLLKEHFAGVKVTDVDAKFLLALRETRSKKRSRNGALVKPATLKKDMDFVRLVLHHARHIEKCLDDLPEFPAFRGEAWEVIPSPRPFLSHDQWVKVRNLAKSRISEPDLNPRSKRQRQEPYWFLLISVGAALRVGECLQPALA